MTKFTRITSAFCLLVLAVSLWSWGSYKKSNAVYYPKPTDVPMTMCGSGFFDWTDTTYVQAKLLPGLGDLHYPVSTTSLKAQEFFEQGLRLVYAFNHWEAIQSFREATLLDPEFAMGYWGLALAYGPNLNDVSPKDRELMAFQSIQKAIERKGHVSEVEKEMIDAMATRYNGRAYESRDSLNQAYATAMKLVANKYPKDAEAQTLCADAIMNTMPWDYWEKDGSPKTATAEAKGLLESTLKAFPNHPGAHHLYIHLVEASPNPELALKSAQFLETAMPGAGHIVHMPAHIYLRTGQYTKSLELNIQAAKVDEEYLANSSNYGMYRVVYYSHNVDFISFSSYMEGRSYLGIQTAMKMGYKGGNITTLNGPWAQYLLVEPIVAFVRFGKWNDILSLSEPDAHLPYAQTMFHFGRGLASVRTGNLQNAADELIRLDSLCALDTLQSFYFSFNPASEIVKVPLHILRGELLLKQNKVEEGLAALREAVAAEDNLRYNEPPDWKIPSRHFLGAALIKAGKFDEAEKIYLEDLKKNPENGWSLTGLIQCQSNTGRKSEMAATAKRFAKAWKNSDVALTASVF